MFGDPGPWILLAAVVGTMLAVDLLLVHRNATVVGFREAAAWSAVWISLALAFGGFVAWSRGGAAGGEYVAGYLIELSLSVDNVFVFALIFGAFSVPAAYQHRLLFWGILGAIVFRGLFIGAGTAILEAAHWVIYLLGAFLVVTGIRLARSRGHAVHPDRNPVLRAFRRLVRTTDDYRGPAFVVRESGRWIATPLLAVLVAIETTDVMFALDSIPAVFAVTTDPFIVFSSNLFAILGLRSLYFLLAGLLDRFAFLRLGLAALLVLAGAKILIGAVYDVPIVLSLSIIVAVLATSIAASVAVDRELRARFGMPMLRVGAGIALGIVAAGLFGLVAAIRDGAPWVAPIASVAALVGAAGAVAAGSVGLARGVAPRWSLAGVRVGSGVVLGVAAIGLLAGGSVLRDLAAPPVLFEIGVLAAGAAAVSLGIAVLRRLQVRTTIVRGWTSLGVAFLLILAAFIALD